MSRSGQKSLSVGHRKAIGFEDRDSVAREQIAKRIFKDDRVEPLREVPPHIIKKAWFTLAHTLLDKGAHVLDVGCTDGAMAYTMAALNPEIYVTGVDINADLINQARKTYVLPNLSFKVGDIFDNLAPPDSVDVIINSFILHEIYSASSYSERAIRQALEAQYAALKGHGVFVIRDHLRPNPNEYVLIEFKDIPSVGDDLMSLSEADLLVWYSNMARARHHPDGAGFFLEELPPNYPRTRLFRIPSKWAWEFFLRKDDRARLEEELAKEYAFYTEQDFRKDLRALGARVSYTAPHWDEGFIQSRFKGHMRLYHEDGTPMGPPPTSSIIVAEKIAQKTSQLVQERRTSRARAGSLYVRTVRDDRSGQISDIVSRDLEIAEVIPYRVTPEGALKVYLHESLPRGLTNSVPRSGKNLDGRRWSGHMTEALALPAHDVRQAKEDGVEAVKEFALSKIGIKASLDTSLQDGPGFFPDPYRIDEKIETYFMRVENQQTAFEPKETLYDLSGFSSKGRMRELDAQDVMNALAVGYIPSSRLEVQLLALFELCDIRHQVWVDMPLQLSEVPVEEVVNIEYLKARMVEHDGRFRDIRGTAGNIRLVQSVFVDEGRDEGGGVTGLAARDMEFIVPENATLNTAVVLPLVRDLSGEVMAGIVTEYLPVPQRYKDTGLTVTLPSFPLPREITDPESARLYVAEQFKVDPKYVARMGESYFSHIGITPHRIYPFVVTNIHGVGGSQHCEIYTPMRYLWLMLYWDNFESFMRIVARAYKTLYNNDQSPRTDFDISLSKVLMKSRISESSVLALGNQLPVMSTSSSPTLSEEVNSTSASGSGKGGNGDKDKMGSGVAVDDIFEENLNSAKGPSRDFTTPKAPA